MTTSIAERDEFDAVVDQGRVCAVAMDCLRDLSDWAAAHPALFPERPFGPTVFSGIALAHAFGCPEPTPARIRMATRITIWAFAADWLLDTAATSRAEIDAIVAGCAAVGDGAAPDDGVPLQGLLAELRDELAATPGWAELRPVWSDHLRRYLTANVREWEWKTAAAHPAFEEYLDNADNLGATFVNVSHWVYVGAARTAGELERLAEAGAETQRALRLLNDLATYERDVSWGDLNALMLGRTHADVTRLLDELVARCEETTRALAVEFPEPAAYLRRQLGHSSGFYGVTDYWGAR